MTSAAALCVWLIVGQAAPPATQPPNRYLVKARKAYESLDYERVTPLLERALKAPSTPEEQVKIYELLATMHVTYGREAEAQQAFQEVLRRQPDYALPDDVSPKIREAFATARQNMPARAPETAAPPAAPPEALQASPVAPIEPVMPSLLAHEHTPLYRKWWFWTALSAVVVAGGAGGWFLLKPEVPEHDFGPIPLR